MTYKSLLTALMFAALVLPASHSMAQTPTIIPVLEELPPHLSFRVAGARDDVLIDGISGAAEGIFLRARAWPPDLDKIQVCFMGGSTALRKKIRDAARAWETVGAKIKFDFGPDAAPRSCQINQTNHIRIGFAYGGYWSMVGQDSYNLANQGEQSMNFGGFDVVPPPDNEFKRIVMHEFGHALGLDHEHQSPFSKCETEFNWTAIYQYLAGPPNGWSKERVDFNMRVLHIDGVSGTPFDPLSIMLYTFPKEFYNNPANATCYHAANYQLSANDGTAMKMLYPNTVAEAVSIRVQDFKDFSALAASATKNQGTLSKALTNFKLMTTTASQPAMLVE